MKKISIFLSVFVTMVFLECCGSLHAEDNENSPFEYRDVYLPEYTGADSKKSNLNNLDEDWALWGHNLSDVLPEKPSLQIYAKIDDEIDKEQFCFSDNRLFEYIKDYIKGNYLFERGLSFSIMPNDNEVVCLCSECVKLGNKAGDASPAVHHLIKKLAAEFPQHNFFTSYYSTTRGLPDEKMAPNAGVIVSAMDYPLSTKQTGKEKQFINILESWKDKTDKVYVWDYINNFDDYFTPFPVFTVMQRRLQKYRDAGVDGVFLNGSGYDFSTFAKLRKAVLAKMLENPDVDWKESLRKYAREYYPTAGDDIADFMIAQEEYVVANGKELPLYEGVYAAKNTYLPEDEFLKFYDKLLQYKKVVAEPEHLELENLADAMAMTVLELKRINGDTSGTDALINRLQRLQGKGVEFYNESSWTVQSYIDDYETLRKDASETEATNKLQGVSLKALSPLDEDYQDMGIVTNGLLGIPTNYHNGNLIYSGEMPLRIEVPAIAGMNRLRVWMVYNPGFKIGLPQEVSLSVDGVKTETKVPAKPANEGDHSKVEFTIPAGKSVVLSFVRNPDIKTMAIEEIQGF